MQRYDDEAFENRWVLIQQLEQQTVSKPTLAPVEDPFDTSFLETSVKQIQNFVENKCGENGIGAGSGDFMDWLPDTAFAVIDGRTARDSSILFFARETVDAV